MLLVIDTVEVVLHRSEVANSYLYCYKTCTSTSVYNREKHGRLWQSKGEGQVSPFSTPASFIEVVKIQLCVQVFTCL